MTPLTPEEFELEMEKISKEKDLEQRHVDADLLLCQTLASLGYGKGTNTFHEMDKWYA